MTGLYWCGWFLTFAWFGVLELMPDEELPVRALAFGFMALFWPVIVGSWLAWRLLKVVVRRRGFAS